MEKSEVSFRKKAFETSFEFELRARPWGVRGTDFFISHSKIDTKTEVAVMRGQVKVKEKKTAKAVQVKKGFSAVVRTKPAPQSRQKAAGKPAMLETRMTAKQELQAIQKYSKVEKVDRAPASADEKEAQAIKEKIQALEKKAVETVLEDVKEYNPEQYEKLASREITSVDEVSAAVVEDMMVKAPEATQGSEPFSVELENLQDSGLQEVL
jgi:DNA-binding ferritin-like protein